MNKITILLMTLFFSNALHAKKNGIGTGESQSITSQPKQATNYFEENKGQFVDQGQNERKDVLFGGNSEGMNFYIQNDGISYQLKQVKTFVTKGGEKYNTSKLNQGSAEVLPGLLKSHRVDVKWVNSNKNIKVEYGTPLPGYVNYYNKQQPIHNIKQYESITLKNVWNGVDIKYFYKDGHLESDFVVNNPADYKKIVLEFQGAELQENNGTLIMKTPLGNISEGSLKVYQGNNTLQSKWILDHQKVSLNIENYQINSPLTIDPPIRIWGTYYGGNGGDEYASCTTDALGNIYLMGTINSTDNIATVGSHQQTLTSGYDGCLVKFNTSGTREWATYYGGNDWEFTHGCATDANNNVYICGETNSTNFIATAGSFQPTKSLDFDCFLVKFNSLGVRQWGTYHGHFDSDAFYDVAIDASDNIFVVGTTRSAENFGTPATHQPNKAGTNNYDGILIKYNTSGGRVWGTYYGGSSGEFINSCTTDQNGNIIITGQTLSTNNIASIGAHQTVKSTSYDAFIAKINPNGTRQWGTYYGGNFDDYGFDCAVDANDNIYVCGQTGSTDAISTVGSHQELPAGTWEAFLLKLNSTGTRQWGTYFGGTGTDIANTCDVNSLGEIYISGTSNSPTGLSTIGSHQETNAGAYDGISAQFNDAGVLQWATYYGGVSDDIIQGSALDIDGNLYFCGYTLSINNIATVSGHQNTFGGGSREMFLVKMGAGIPLPVTIEDFNAQKISNHVALSWTSSNEVNFDYFEIEKSLDASTWYKIATVNAIGNAISNTKYTEIDNQPVQGMNFYRLKLVDIDGRIQYSDVQNIKFDLATQVQCYPNPTNDILYISIPSSAAEINIKLYTSTGKYVASYSTNNNTFSIPTSKFVKGHYIIKISSNDYTTNEMILIQ